MVTVCRPRLRHRNSPGSTLKCSASFLICALLKALWPDKISVPSVRLPNSLPRSEGAHAVLGQERFKASSGVICESSTGNRSDS